MQKKNVLRELSLFVQKVIFNKEVRTTPRRITVTGAAKAEREPPVSVKVLLRLVEKYREQRPAFRIVVGVEAFSQGFRHADQIALMPAPADGGVKPASGGYLRFRQHHDAGVALDALRGMPGAAPRPVHLTERQPADIL